MRVMSFNARKDTSQPDGTDGRDGSDAWPHRRELLLEDIFAQNPDILGTQELMPHMAAWLREQLEPAGYSFVGRGRRATLLERAARTADDGGTDDDGGVQGIDGTDEMTAVFFRKSRFSLVESGHFWLSDTPEVPGSMAPDTPEGPPRMATWLRLRDSVSTAPGDGTLLVMNTHLANGADSTQSFGARVIMKFLEEDRASRAEPQSVILSGDMNSNETSAAIATLRSGTGTAQLVDTYREFHPEPREMQATSHPAWFAEEATSSGDHPTPPFGKRIDFIFASTAAFEVVEAMIDRFEDKGSLSGRDIRRHTKAVGW